jgi:hypothetical protein
MSKLRRSTIVDYRLAMEFEDMIFKVIKRGDLRRV